MTGTVVRRRWPPIVFDSPCGTTITWPPRMKATWGRPAVAGDRVGEAFQRLFEQRRFVLDGADRLAPGAVGRFQFGFGAEVAEVVLVDLQGVGQGQRERFDVGVAFAGVEVEADRGSWPRAVALWPPSWVIDIFGAKGRVAQLTAWK